MIDLKILRIKKGLSQKQLASMLGMSPSTICGLETGKKKITELKLYKLKNIADVLGITVNELLESN